MRRKMFVSSFVLLTVLALSVTGVFGADMFSGTWKLNLAKSTFSPGPPPEPPKEPVIQKITGVDNGIRMVEDGVNAKGQKEHGDFTVKFDGKDYPSMSMLDGKPNPAAADMISGKRIDDYNFELTLKVMGRLMFTAKNVISKDGKTRTATQTATTAQGETRTRTLFFEKQ
jgi:hypothetical protein